MQRLLASVILPLSCLLCACKEPPADVPGAADTEVLSDDSLFTLVQERTFRYFWDGAEPVSGMARERIHLDGVYPDDDRDIVTSGGSGFGIMAILVGIHRGFITRQEGRERLERMVGWLERADRFHGMYPHWLDGPSGKVKPFSRYDDGGDLVESAFLFQGLLCARQYFQAGDPAEQALAARMDTLWRAAEWDFHRGPDQENVLFWHWSPKHGWKMDFRISGWNECLIAYVLAAASPTHSVPAEVYHQGWARGGAIRGEAAPYGLTLALRHNGAEVDGGPLFWAHYSFTGLDPRGLKDQYADYWEHNRHHALSNYRHCVENPGRFAGYGPACWGLTASYSTRFYAAHRPGEDLGVVSPTAALSSFPYTPTESMAAMRYFYDTLGGSLMGPYGFYDAFSQHVDWFPRRYLAIDQGPILVMMENHRTGLLWNLFTSCPEIRRGLATLGFE
ncbi:MAG: hypothetical protein RLY31_375 [Bacteroidota bacterium]